MGSPFNYGFFSGHYNDYPVVDTFLDRLWNFIVNYKEEQKFYYYTSDQTDLMRKYLDLPNLPDIRELERNVSLAIVNSHHSYHGIRAVTPAIVEVGGIHIVESDQKVNPVKDFGKFFAFFLIIISFDQFRNSYSIWIFPRIERSHFFFKYCSKYFYNFSLKFYQFFFLLNH